MTIYTGAIVASWLVFLAVWTVMAFSAKRTLNRGRYWWRQIVMRLAIILAILVSVRSPAVRHALRAAQPVLVIHNPAAGAVGALLCIMGVGLAIWARLIMGRNWGMPMTRKEDPELVTAGPFAMIRHPIYSGMLLAMLGSLIGGTVIVFLPLALVGGYFIYSARREEKLMLEQFPASYPAYKARTKMLLPFIF